MVVIEHRAEMGEGETVYRNKLSDLCYNHIAFSSMRIERSEWIEFFDK